MHELVMSFPQPQQPNDEEEARRREAEAAAMRQRVLQVLLDQKARQRLMNIRLVKPDLAAAVENYLINAASSGRLNKTLTDEELKQILMRLQQPKKDFKIDRR
jgi:programmed cell death protein 5